MATSSRSAAFLLLLLTAPITEAFLTHPTTAVRRHAPSPLSSSRTEQQQQQQDGSSSTVESSISAALDEALSKKEGAAWMSKRSNDIIKKAVSEACAASASEIPMPPTAASVEDLAAASVEEGGADPKASNDESPYNIALRALLIATEAVSAAKDAVAVATAAEGFAEGAATTTGAPATTGKKQDFLEASPYHDTSSIPMNTYKAKSPFVGKISSVKRIVGPRATGEICHIVIDHQGKMPYWEGQSLAVTPPGKQAESAGKSAGKPHKPRLYSIASTRYGDANDMDGSAVTLCVRRATYFDPELGAEDPAKKGVCSNFLCDAKAGDSVTMTGPSGKTMLLPEAEPATDVIMVATGTGIAPFRGFWRRLFLEQTPAAANFKGLLWMFLGVANSDGLLYDDELQGIAEKTSRDSFRVDYALSREQENKKGGKMYIQDKVEEHADEIFERLDNGAHIYFCGLKGMMPGIQDMLDDVCRRKGLGDNAKDFVKGLKKKGQWHVEVY